MVANTQSNVPINRENYTVLSLKYCHPLKFALAQAAWNYRVAIWRLIQFLSTSQILGFHGPAWHGNKTLSHSCDRHLHISRTICIPGCRPTCFSFLFPFHLSVSTLFPRSINR